jgi:hypothetical protein
MKPLSIGKGARGRLTTSLRGGSLEYCQHDQQRTRLRSKVNDELTTLPNRHQ